MEGLEPEHFLDPEPGDRFGLGQHEPEAGAEEEVAEVHGGQRPSSQGRKTQVIRSPPARKQPVAIIDGHWRFDIPMIECPEVQPPAYRVPKPTRNPPTTTKMNPLRVRSAPKLKISAGWRPPRLPMPEAWRSATVAAEIRTGSEFRNTIPPRTPPSTMPAASTRFQLSFFQS